MNRLDLDKSKFSDCVSAIVSYMKHIWNLELNSVNNFVEKISQKKNQNTHT